MHLDDIRTQFDHLYWARDRLLPLVGALSPEEFVRPMGTSHGSVRGTLAHMIGSEWIWCSRWLGASPTDRPSEEAMGTVALLRERWEGTEKAIRSYLATMQPGEEQRVVRYRTLDGRDAAYPWWQTALQVTTHSSYHRGQVVTLLRQLGHAAVGTDLILFFKERARG